MLAAHSREVLAAVFPLAQVAPPPPPDAKQRFVSHVGTAFLIGRRGFALTARHLFEDVDSELSLVGMAIDELGGWTDMSIVDTAFHPQQDIALLKLAGERWASPFQLGDDGAEQNTSREYMLVGYPGAASFEPLDGQEEVAPAPDLVYFRGYVRRRATRRLEGLPGTAFLELSEPAYGGCAGGPLWQLGAGGRLSVLGLYLGHLNTHSTAAPFVAVGYAACAQTFRDWAPAILGRTLEDEMKRGV